MNSNTIIYKQVSTDWLEDSNPDFVKSEPDLIGRVQGATVDVGSVRCETSSLVSVRVPFEGAAIGAAMIDIFEGRGDGGDDDGVVIRCTIQNDASAFQPHAVVIGDGVDLHMAGTTEAVAFLEALQRATAQALFLLQSRNTAPGAAVRRSGFAIQFDEVNALIQSGARSGPGKH